MRQSPEAPRTPPRHRAHNELGAVVLGAYLWAVFLTEAEMRTDLLNLLFADRFDSWWLELLVDVWLWVHSLVVLTFALHYPFQPFTSDPNWSESRSGIYFLHFSVNSICAVTLGWRAYTDLPRWSPEWLIPVGIALVALVEFWCFLQQPGDHSDLVDPREAGPRHGVVAWTFAAAAFLLVHRNGSWYWAESIAIGAMLAMAFAYLLPLLLPLDPLGTRTRRSTGPNRGWQEELVASDRDAQAFQAALDRPTTTRPAARSEGSRGTEPKIKDGGEAPAGPPRPDDH